MRFKLDEDIEANQDTAGSEDPIAAALESFYADDLIVGAPEVVKSGKEATVFRCRAHPSTGGGYLAAKVYRPRESRGFKNDSVYLPGRDRAMKARERRAVTGKTRFGRQVLFGSWVAHEYGTLRHLHARRADVPRPIACSASALLMEYVGDGEAPAPQLIGAELHHEEVRRLFDRVLRNVEIGLACHWVHGDLSAYNILYLNGQITVIDFPQAADARFNPNARALLERDVENVCRYFGGYGVDSNPGRICRDLWGRYQMADI